MALSGDARIDSPRLHGDDQVAPISPGGWFFFVYLAFAIVSLSPFPDLGDPRLLAVTDGNETLTYFIFLTFAGAAGFLVWRNDRPALRSLLIPSYVGLAGWIGVTSVISQDPATSIKRAAMLVFVVVGAATLFLLPRDREEMTRLFSFLALLVIGLSYFGVIFMPQYAIHQASDLGEPHLAGDWRGVFGHKNMTSSIFSVLTFIGLYVKTQRPAEGWSIFVLSLLFVFASGGKSSTIICVATIALSSFSFGATRSWGWGLTVFLPLVVLNLVGVGSVAFPQIGALVAALPVDSTFTGRSDIWAFALEHALSKPIFGHGYLAFWNTEAMVYGGGGDGWASTASHAHNGYLDAVVSMGIPGLALFLAALVVQPARDIAVARARGEEPELTLLFQRIWMFSLYLSALETFVFQRAHPSWVLMLFAVFSLRYLSQFRVAHENCH